MIFMREMQKKKRFYRELAVLMSAILLAGQYDFPVRAEENAEMPGSEARGGNAETGDSVSGGDAGTAGEYFYFPFDSSNRYRILSDDQAELVQAASSQAEKYAIPDEVTDPDTNIRYTVTSIGERAFYNGPLREVEIPNTITNIGANAFRECQSLTSIQIPEGVTSIGEEAFWHCDELTSIQIPDSVTSIGKGAFSNCAKLKSANIPHGITAVSEMLFTWTALDNVEIPYNITAIGGEAFRCCKFTDIQIPDSVTTMGHGVFAECKNLKNIVIPDTVMSMDYGTFDGCDNLVKAELSHNIQCITARTFFDCISLTTVIIPDKVESIEESAFMYCSALDNITIPSGVTYIDSGAFKYCDKFQTLKIAVKTETDGDQVTVKPVSLGGDDVFFTNETDLPRKLTFLTEDGKTELSDTTVPTLEAAREAYQNVNDGDVGDNYWYGWYLGEAPDIGDKDLIHSVTIQVYIDNEEQTDHGRSFMLKKADEDTWVTDLTRVNNGIYEIYEAADVQSRAAQAAGLDTRVTVEVNGQDAVARVDYYTVTFYDGDMAYSDDTPQRQQTLLKGYLAVRPVDPVKEGVVFREWVTGAQEEEAFDFNRELQEKTAIYAAWTVKEPEEPNKPEEPDTPEEPDNKPEEPDTPEEPDNKPEEPDSKPEGPEKPEGPDKPEGPEEPEEPDSKPEGPEKPEGPDKPEEPEVPSGPDNKPEKPDNKPEEPEMPEEPGPSEVSDKPTGGESNEPKTGDTSQVEVYATIAMIAGMLYLLLYFADQERGMTEETKKELVSVLVRWAKRGGRLRRYAAIAAIFCLLCYYHSIGKSHALRKSLERA